MYKKAGVSFGQLSYGYDRGGLRTELSGTFARTGLPGVLATGTYDDSNRLTARGATTYSYDDVGNMISNGTQTFAWNPRGQLTQITGGPVTASFVYDATGRRRQATFNATTTSFLNDGPNVAQDLQGGAAVVTYTNGLRVDSNVARTDSTGTQARVPDALGSTVALTDASGNVATDYTHDPYGNPSTLGAATSNRIGYAGREIDPTGLSYNRNRYYSSALARFASEDPIGMNGGQINRWAYVGNDPFGFRDPYGLCVIGFEPMCGAGSAVKNAISVGGHWVSDTGDSIGNGVGDGFGWVDDHVREPVQGAVLGCVSGVADYVQDPTGGLLDAVQGAEEGAAVSIFDRRCAVGSRCLRWGGRERRRWRASRVRSRGVRNREEWGGL